MRRSLVIPTAALLATLGMPAVAMAADTPDTPPALTASSEDPAPPDFTFDVQETGGSSDPGLVDPTPDPLPPEPPAPAPDPDPTAPAPDPLPPTPDPVPTPPNPDPSPLPPEPDPDPAPTPLPPASDPQPAQPLPDRDLSVTVTPYSARSTAASHVYRSTAPTRSLAHTGAATAAIAASSLLLGAGGLGALKRGRKDSFYIPKH